MARKRIYYLVGALLFMILFFSVFRPVKIGDREDALIQTGTVQEIFEGGDKDIVFELAETETRYYINRGLEQGLSLEELRHQLYGKEVIIRYPKHWTLLDPGSSTNHLSELEFEGEILFTEYD